MTKLQKNLLWELEPLEKFATLLIRKPWYLSTMCDVCLNVFAKWGIEPNDIELPILAGLSYYSEFLASQERIPNKSQFCNNFNLLFTTKISDTLNMKKSMLQKNEQTLKHVCARLGHLRLPISGHTSPYMSLLEIYATYIS